MRLVKYQIIGYQKDPLISESSILKCLLLYLLQVLLSISVYPHIFATW